MLRKHQQEFLDICTELRAGKAPRVKSIICSTTPGGGKSLLPVIAASQLLGHLADRIAWVVPRRSLQHQAEQEFLKGHGRQIFGHQYTIRRSTNEPDPCRGLAGFVTTYQAIGLGNLELVKEFQNRRYILVLDEPHHVEEDSVWQTALEPLVQRAALTIYMSGTLERGNRKRIAFLPYRYGSEGEVVDLGATDTSVAIEYNRHDALSERAILPIHFELMDAESEWIGTDGSTYSNRLSEAVRDTSEALYTALKTQFAYQLLDECVRHWTGYRAVHKRSKLLVVTANIEDAKKYVDHLLAAGIRTDIATSDDAAHAAKNIERYKKIEGAKALDALVTVAMAYEGLDVPPVTHIACLTHIRSKPWIEQMIARATRFDAPAGLWETQTAYVYVPDDFYMGAIIRRMQEDQAHAVKIKTEFEDDGLALLGALGVGTIDRASITPLGSQASDRRQSQIGQVTLFPIGAPGASLDLTPTQQEAILRDKIHAHCKQIDLTRFGKNWGETNRRIAKQFKKPRARMTIFELRRVQDWLDEYYRL